MHHSKNNASHVQHYLNRQLVTLWHIAMDCIQHHTGDLEYALKPQEASYRYSFALAEYHFGKHSPETQASIEDMMFHARFKAPTIDFVCNHVAQLNLHLEEGHYNLDLGRASDSTTANHDRNQVFSEMTVSFRVPIKTTGIRAVDSLIGNGEHFINLFVLDYANASLVTILPSPESAMPVPVVEHYLKHYLRFLLAAGHHVLYSLPDFHDEEHLLLIDFSWGAQMAPDLQEVHGISIDHVNIYLADAWKKAVMLSNEHRGQPPDRPAISLAEYRSTWTISSLNAQSPHFHLLLNAPQVAALCNDEVVVYFSVQEASFYENDDFDQVAFQRFKGWKVAVLMDLFYESEDGDNLKRCRLNMQSARYMRQFSEFPGYDERDDRHNECMDVLVDFLCGDYLTILEDAQHHIIYHYAIRSPPSDREHSPLAVIDESRGAVAWKDVAQHSDMCDFDEIIALSQAAINGHFRNCWAKSREDGRGLWYTWEHGDRFKGTFKPLAVRLLSNDRALVSISVTQGFFRFREGEKPLNGWEQIAFSDCRITFEVELRIAGHTHVPDVGPGWLGGFEKSQASNDHRGRDGMTFRHIYLDLMNADFIEEHSHFDSKLCCTPDMVQDLIAYIRKFYLQELVSKGDHILYTIPIWRGHRDVPVYGLTDVTFHLHSRETVTRKTAFQGGRVTEPVILITGMSGRRPFPTRITPSFSSAWVARTPNSTAYGTICLSNRVFFRHKLLSIISGVNRRTTVIPILSGVDGKEWELQLVPWETHPSRKSSTCPFAPAAATTAEKDAGLLKYQWEHCDVYNYEHRGGIREMNGKYTAMCSTLNNLRIRTNLTRGTMEIVVQGHIDLELSMNLPVSSLQWSSHASVGWKSTLTVSSGVDGLSVEADCLRIGIPTSRSDGHVHHPLFCDAALQLQKHIPNQIELSAVVEEFEQFCGVWKSFYPANSAFRAAHPVFNSSGDLLFEIRPYSSNSSST